MRTIYATALLVLLHFNLQAQSTSTVRDALLKIRRVPYKYLNPDWIILYNIQVQSKSWDSGDSAYDSVVKIGPRVIPQLIPILLDTANTMIFNSFEKDILRYGQLAAILIDDIETINYYYTTGIQWCDVGYCSLLPFGFLEYIKLHAGEFQQQYKSYFYSKTRQEWLLFERKIRKQNP